MAPTAIIGATGLVGGFILSTLLKASSPQTIQTITRRTPLSTGPTLQAVVEPDTTLWADRLAALSPAPSTVVSSLGTTRVAAGGIANQWKIDHDLNVELAEQAKKQGVRNFVFVSSAGVRSLVARQLPYSQMKIGVEDTIQRLDFDQAIIVKPGFIIGDREVPHQGVWIAFGLIKGLAKVAGQWAADKMGQEAEVIARATVHAMKLAEQGKAPSKYWVIEADEIIKLGRTEWKDL